MTPRKFILIWLAGSVAFLAGAFSLTYLVFGTILVFFNDSGALKPEVFAFIVVKAVAIYPVLIGIVALIVATLKAQKASKRS